MSADGGLCFFLYGKTQLCRKTDGPHDAQGILRKTFIGIAHAPYDSFFQILPAAKGVHQAFLFIIGHGINGKIPSFQIFN